MSWDAMLEHQSTLARRRELSALTKVELIDLIQDLEAGAAGAAVGSAHAPVSKLPLVQGEQVSAEHENGCHPGCRHECGECRLGLGVHRTCDPRCEVAEHEVRSHRD